MVMPAMHPMPAIRRQDITGLILAGGQGTRMGGCDKGLQTLHGRPLAAAVIERLAPQVGALLINANRNLECYAAFGYPVLSDSRETGWGAFPGPLAGLHAGLGQCATPWLLSVPCDVPDLPADLVARLAEALGEAGCRLAVASSAGRSHPVIALLHRDLLAGLTGYLDAGQRRVFGWQQTVPHVTVDFGADVFANLNTLADLRGLEEGSLGR